MQNSPEEIASFLANRLRVFADDLEKFGVDVWLHVCNGLQSALAEAVDDMNDALGGTESEE